jgi:hypothetical protein
MISSPDDDCLPEEIKKPLCQLCTVHEHKYRCPRCDMLTCSLACAKAHKEKYACSGVRDHVASLRVKMQDFSLGTMRKDLRFIDQAIVVSNKTKKTAAAGPATISKKVKNLRYFLRKKRNIIYKHSPSPMFARAANNTTYFDTSAGQEKHIVWTMELIFLRNAGNLGAFNPFHCEKLA